MACVNIVLSGWMSELFKRMSWNSPAILFSETKWLASQRAFGRRPHGLSCSDAAWKQAEWIPAQNPTWNPVLLLSCENKYSYACRKGLEVAMKKLNWMEKSPILLKIKGSFILLISLKYLMTAFSVISDFRTPNINYEITLSQETVLLRIVTS